MNPRFRLTRALVSAGNKMAVREKIGELKAGFLRLQEENPGDEQVRKIGERLEGIEKRLS